MNKFKVGQRVRVYGFGQICAGFAAEGDAQLIFGSAVISDIFPGASADLRVKVGESPIVYAVSSKQCRRLKKKEKRKAREIWVHPAWIENKHGQGRIAFESVNGFKHFREVL